MDTIRIHTIELIDNGTLFKQIISFVNNITVESNCDDGMEGKETLEICKGDLLISVTASIYTTKNSKSITFLYFGIKVNFKGDEVDLIINEQSIQKFMNRIELKLYNQ